MSKVALPSTVDIRFQAERRAWFAGFELFLDAARRDPQGGSELVRTVLPTTTMDEESFRNEIANLFPGGVYSLASSVMSALLSITPDSKAAAAARLQRDEAYWGPDAGLFRPSRWAEMEGKCPIGSRMFFPFGRGERHCLGQHFALFCGTVLLGELLRRAWTLDVGSHRLGYSFACMVHEGVKGTVA